MKKAILVASALVIVAGLSIISSQARAAESKKGGAVVLMPADDIKWTDVPQFPGVKMAVVQGDAKTPVQTAWSTTTCGASGMWCPKPANPPRCKPFARGASKRHVYVSLERAWRAALIKRG